MRTLERDKRPLYLCEKIEDSNPIQFKEPVKMRLNIVATVSEEDLVTFGNSYKEYRRAKTSISNLDKFHEGDRAYIYTKPPKKHDPLCETADFYIASVSDSVSEISILFKRLQYGDNTQSDS